MGGAIVAFLPWAFSHRYALIGGLASGGLAGDSGLFAFPPLPDLLVGPFVEGPVVTGPAAWWAYLVWAVSLAGGLVVVVTCRSSGQNPVLSNVVLLTLTGVGGMTSVLLLDYLWDYWFFARQLFIYSPVILLLFSAVCLILLPARLLLGA